jgi:hypothetical protein
MTIISAEEGGEKKEEETKKPVCGSGKGNKVKRNLTVEFS